MSDHFVTEFGNRIDFVPGYYQQNRFYADWALSKWSSRRAYENEAAPESVSASMLAKDWVLFSALVYFLARNELLKTWNTGIDLGGAEGTIIRLFKSSGYVSHATNLDIMDFSSAAPDSQFADFIEKIRASKPLGPRATEALNFAKIHLDFFGQMGTAAGMFTKFSHPPTIDSGLVMSVYDAPGSYDLVVANALLEFVDLDKALLKIRSILKPGGTFVGAVNAAWCPVVPSGVLGDFPYLFQRLTLKDAARYYAEFYPEHLQNLEGRYNWFHEGKYRPTLSDWFALFEKYGLRIVAFERVSPRQQQRYRHTPAQLLKEPWFNRKDVLRDAHHLHPDVTIDDLSTTAYRFAVQ